MPKTSKQLPPSVRPYDFHGLTVVDPDTDSPKTDCPFCGRDGKLGISNKDDDDGRFRCVACDTSGNPASFCEQLHALSLSQTSAADYEKLAEYRGLPAEALKAWGAAKSATTGEWVVPAYSASGKVVNLYRYAFVGDGHVLMQTPSLPGGLFGYHLWDDDRPNALVCEGPWDGIAVWHALSRAGKTGEYNVVARPGAAFFSDTWVPIFAEKVVGLLNDNDHPRQEQGKTHSPAGWEGVKKAVSHLMGGDTPPKSVSFLAWDCQDEGFDASTGGKGYRASLPDGFDCRDYLSPRKHKGKIDGLLAMLRPCPPSWGEGHKRRGANRGDYVRPQECKSWKTLVVSWEKAALWDWKLEGALATVLASIASVPGQGEQCWVKLISPPSTFKSKLCTAVATARKYTVEDDGMNGFFSGHKSGKDGEDAKDHSLVSKLYNKTLITKEGATLVDSPMRDIVISQARSLYDGSASKTYNNGLRWEHHGLRFTWILAGTKTLRRLDASELGQRFIDYVIMEDIDPVFEKKILNIALYKQVDASRVTSNGTAESTVDSAYLAASKLTGGYVEHLRRVAPDYVKDVIVPAHAVERISRLASFIEYMRARPSDLDDSGGRALATRVAGQIMKTCQYMAVVMEKSTVSHASVWRVAEKIAQDTARGRTFKIAEVLYDNPKGLNHLDVSRLTGEDKDEERGYLNFLRKLGAVEAFDNLGRKTLAMGKYRLTKRFTSLYKEAVK